MGCGRLSTLKPLPQWLRMTLEHWEGVLPFPRAHWKILLQRSCAWFSRKRRAKRQPRADMNPSLLAMTPLSKGNHMQTKHQPVRFHRCFNQRRVSLERQRGSGSEAFFFLVNLRARRWEMGEQDPPLRALSTTPRHWHRPGQSSSRTMTCEGGRKPGGRGEGREGEGREGKERGGKGRRGEGREGEGREGKERGGKGRRGEGREGEGREGKERGGRG